MPVSYFGWPSDGSDPSGGSLDRNNPNYAHFMGYATGGNDTFVCPGSGVQNVESLKLFGKSNGGTPGYMRMAVYDGSKNLVFQHASKFLVIGSVSTWQGDTSFSPSSPTLTGGASYYIANSWDTSNDMQVYYRTVTSAMRYISPYTYYNDGFPASFTGAANLSREYSVRCGVEPAVAVGQPTIKRFGGIPFAALNKGVW